MVQLERLASEEFLPRKKLIYVDASDLHSLYDKIAFKGNHVLVGPKGIGKSLSVQKYAELNGIHVVTFDCSEDVRRSQLLGSFVIRGGDTPFILGPIPTAFEIANEEGRCILVLEEINALTPQMQKILNPVTDFRRRLEVPEAKKVFRLEEGKELWVVGTMNFSVYGGVYALNEDLKSRFRMIPTNYPSSESELTILRTLTPKADSGILEGLIRLAYETRQGALDYALSTRDLQQIVEDTYLVGLDMALRISSGKFEGEDVVAYKSRVESIFGNVDIWEEHEAASGSRV